MSLKSFIAGFIEELKSRGEKVPGEKEIQAMISISNNLFHTETEEEDLVTSEAANVQRLCTLTAEIIRRQGISEQGKIDPDLKALAGVLTYLRSHTMDKLNYLRKIKGTIAIILAESKECRKYDKLIRSFSRRKDPGFRRKAIDEFDYMVKAMKDVRQKAKQIEEAIKIVRINSQNMRNILKGKYDKPFGKMKPLPKLLADVLEYNRSGFVLERINEMRDIIARLDEILIKQTRRMPGLRRKIKKVERREKQAVGFITRYGKALAA